MISWFKTKKLNSMKVSNTNIHANEKVIIPIFIIGVLRSGTTLLRVILDSHSKIAGASETPWILGGYGNNSIRDLTQYLIEGEYCPVKNMKGVTANTVMTATRLYLSEILKEHLFANNKQLLVLKTPQDIKYLEFLTGLYPEAKYIHIFRDGRDSACSLVENVSSVFANEIEDYGELNHVNAFKRWYDWEVKVRRIFDQQKIKYVRIKYEELVQNPADVIGGVCNFIGVDFETDMLKYNSFKHDFPNWEAGTYDLKKKKNIDDSSIGRWKSYFDKDDTQFIMDNYGEFLHSLGYD